MKVPTLNPVRLIRNYLASANASAPVPAPASTATQQPPAPVNPGSPGTALTASPTQAVNGVPVQGTFIDASQLQGLIGSIVANTQHHRKLVESFDEDREPFMEAAIRKAYMGIFYLLPTLCAYFVGSAIGDYIGGAHFTLTDGWNASAHVLSWAGEFMISGLVIAGSIALRRIRSASSEYIPYFVLIALFLLLTSAGSGVFQYKLMDAHLHLQAGDQLGAIFRSAIAPIVDIGALLFLAVMRFKSLKKFLQDQMQRQEAIRATNQSEIAIQAEQVKAALDMQAALNDLAMKAERAKVWNELERMQGQSMIDNAKRNMHSDGESGGYYRRSRY
jgi:hypothetical protein